MTAPDDAKAIADVLSGARRWCVITGDCLNVLPTIPAASVDAVVTDPPYGLAFMGKRWDYDVPGVEAWGGCLAAMKPGAHLLSFAGTRTQHRMAVRIEDAGFEIRDMIAWVYGSGFPKSLDVSKAIDKAAGAKGGRGPMKRGGERLARLEDGKRDGEGRWGNETGRDPFTYLPATDAARQWSGWGTALKPALEPITVARKPLEGTVAENVLVWGTGAMNVDGCRVGTDDTRGKASKTALGLVNDDGWQPREITAGSECGRWPANLIHDGSDEVVGLFPNAGGSKPGSFQREKTSRGLNGGGYGQERASMREPTELQKPGYADSGSAARFFYCAKASKRDRDDDNHHPTVKPTELMRYLCRLVTPNGGVVLDPFAGSGSTGKAALAAGFRFIGIELDPHYADIARRRIAEAAETLWTTESKPEQGSLLPPTPGAAPASRGASA